MTATYPTHTKQAHGHSRLGILGSVVRGVADGITFLFDGIIRSNAMMREYDRLIRLSDSRLAAEGLSRKDIPQQLAKTYPG